MKLAHERAVAYLVKHGPSHAEALPVDVTEKDCEEIERDADGRLYVETDNPSEGWLEQMALSGPTIVTRGEQVYLVEVKEVSER